jgi:AraC-like DNA-binding protein
VTKPYKIKEKTEKDANYRGLIRAELADELYDKILTLVVAEKKYRDPEYSARQLAKDLDTNPRYLSAVINSRFGMNYSSLVNEHRVRDAAHMLVDRRYVDKTMEEIGLMCGFANRQSFYAAFFKEKGEAPHQYKKRHQPK